MSASSRFLNTPGERRQVLCDECPLHLAGCDLALDSHGACSRRQKFLMPVKDGHVGVSGQDHDGGGYFDDPALKALDVGSSGAKGADDSEELEEATGFFTRSIVSQCS